MLSFAAVNDLSQPRTYHLSAACTPPASSLHGNVHVMYTKDGSDSGFSEMSDVYMRTESVSVGR